jgi:hypothetical protein
LFYGIICNIETYLILFNIMVFGQKIVGVTYDILRGVNTTVWGGTLEAEKVGKIVKTGLSGADVVIGTSHALEDLACNDKVCFTLDVIGSLSSTVGIVIGNIPSTKHLTFITGSVTVGCRSVRYYCQNYGTFWGCSVAVGQGVKKAIKFSVKSKS